MIHEKAGSNEVDRLGESRRILAEVERAAGRDEAALRLARQNVAAAAARLDDLSRQSSYLAEFAPTDMRRQVGQALDLLWEAGAPRDPAVAAEMFEVAQLVHLNETTRATNGFLLRSVADDDEATALIDARRDAAGALRAAGMRLTEPGGATDGALLARIATLRERLAELDAALSAHLPDLVARLAPEPVAAEAVRAALQPGEAVWMQATFASQTFLFLVGVEGLSVARVSYGDDALEADIDALRRTLDLARNPTLDVPFDVAAARSVFNRLFGPFIGALPTLHRIAVVPDRAAQQVSLTVLARDDAGYDAEFGAGHATARFLGLTHALAVAPSPAAFLRWRAASSSAAGDGGFMGFGDPVLHGEGLSRARGAVRAITRGTGLADPKIVGAMFEPLPETADELRRMAGRRGGGGARLFLGPAATEAAVKSADYAGVGTVAFATHAIVSGTFDSLLEPALVLTPPERPTARDDGLLTAGEIAQLSINAELVVLSACNTGSPSGRPGASGLSGLAAGFFQAGARSMVVSHWTVNTISSVLLMPSLFREAEDGTAPSEALRRAMFALANDGRAAQLAHPAIWAPFTLVADR